MIRSTTQSLNTTAKALSALLLIHFLVACSKEPVEWIDVPLSEDTFFSQNPGLNSDVVQIPVPANSDLEYMLEMQKGHSVSYQWLSSDLVDPGLLLAEFHGHTIRLSEAPGEVMFYQQGRGDSANGYLVAPFDGVHGWYFSNETSSDITVVLTLNGFYHIP